MQVLGAGVERGDVVLTPAALEFVGRLHRRFAARRDELLARRRARREEVARTGSLGFLPETAGVRAGDWRVAELPADLRDRRVEITGPTERRMTINALNSGAKVWLADLEDANTPHWSNVVAGQVNLHDAVRRQIAHTAPDGRRYELAAQELPVVVVRPRGWHFDERHLRCDGEPVVAALVDFGLHAFHNAAELLARGSGPYFYLPKLESHLEARLWADVFAAAEDELGLARGSIRATVLIETITAAFEMDEILYELREHAVGLNAGRWDYLFSIIKNFAAAGERFVLPDRSDITMTAPAMRAYAQLLVRTCHRRGAMAIGGMAAFIPSRKDPGVNETAFAKVREDKTREAGDGFDGSWVAHPDLVPVCREVFDARLGERPNQLGAHADAVPEDEEELAARLLAVAETPGRTTEAGLRGNVDVCLQYVEAWLAGSGAVAVDNLMEDAATAEISRSQLWQWIRNRVVLDTGVEVTAGFVRDVIAQQHAALRERLGAERFDAGRFEHARDLLERTALSEDFVEFLTLPAYDLVVAEGR